MRCRTPEGDQAAQPQRPSTPQNHCFPFQVEDDPSFSRPSSYSDNIIPAIYLQQHHHFGLRCVLGCGPDTQMGCRRQQKPNVLTRRKCPFV